MSETSNIIDYSSLKQYYTEKPYLGFGVKYVISGTELYTANGNRFYVNNGEYLLTNQYCEGNIEIDSKEFVKGICIDITPSTILEVIANQLGTDDLEESLDLKSYFNSGYFLENKYHATETSLGKLLLNLEYQIKNNFIDLSQFNNDFYFTVAEKIIQDNVPIIQQLQQLKSARTSTKKDLLRKLLEGKNYLEKSFQLNIKVADVARQVGMSEYHFLRLFKNTFGYSPYQFLIQLRLEKAKILIINENEAISTIASKLGFSDKHAFSKSFKKYFGFPPSALIKT